MKHKKPWGHFTNLLEENYTKVKKILIKPGHSPSYQYHFKRSEIWIIVKGEAKIKIEGINRNYKKGDVINIPLSAKHRISNIGGQDLIFIEIQLGTYFGEDDIIRLEDAYGRL